MTASKFKRPPTAQEAVLTELRRAIAAGELAPGEQVLQDALADRFGVSRVPLREALKILEGEGQVTYRPHRGYFIAELDMEDLREVYRIRDLLESEALEAAVARLTDDDLDDLGRALEDIDAAAATDDISSMAKANRLFHLGIVEAAGMPRLSRLVRILWDATDVYRARYYADAKHRRDVHAEHEAILRSLRARDVEAAKKLLREHRDHAVRTLEASMKP
jgi:DNA-binding GntR family transcriptional regulator